MKKLYITTAIALLASPVLAEITPAEVWQSWQDDFAGLGITLTAEQAVQGNVLILRNVKSEVNIGFLSFEQVLEELRLEALADGSVSATHDSTITGGVTLGLPDEAPRTISIEGVSRNTSGLITGSVDDYVYEYTVGSMSQTGKTGEGEANSTSFESVLTDYSGRIHTVHADDGVTLTFDFTIGEVASTQTSTSSFGSQEARLEQVMQTLATGYKGEVSAFFPAPSGQSGGFIPEGFRLDARLGMETSELNQSTVSPYFKMALNVVEGPGSYLLNIGAQTIGMWVDTHNAVITATSPQIGNQPLSAEIRDAKFGLVVPFRASDTPQDASLELRLEGVTVNDVLWAMADPANTLSHAPADFILDTRANTNLLLDWTDIDAIEALQGPPAILNSIKLQDFLIAFENARLTGVGVVEFSNDGPAPEPNGGMLNFSFDGVLALLDKLGDLPLVDPSLTAGAKGMLGAFTSAGNGPENLTSQIEFSAGGHVSINGMQVR